MAIAGLNINCARMISKSIRATMSDMSVVLTTAVPTTEIYIPVHINCDIAGLISGCGITTMTKVSIGLAGTVAISGVLWCSSIDSTLRRFEKKVSAIRRRHENIGIVSSVNCWIISSYIWIIGIKSTVSEVDILTTTAKAGVEFDVACSIHVDGA